MVYDVVGLFFQYLKCYLFSISLTLLILLLSLDMLAKITGLYSVALFLD